MDKSEFAEFAKQINDAVSALIEVKGMEAENKIREQQGLSLAYDEDAFLNVLRTYGLGYNGNIEKRNRF